MLTMAKSNCCISLSFECMLKIEIFCICLGYFPNVARNSITNAAELVSYDMLKSFILRRHILKDNFPCHFLCGFGAGFIATIIASPVDVVKTRTMNAHPGPQAGALNIAYSILKEGGPLAFYKG